MSIMPSKIRFQIDQDYRIFFVFMTLVMIGIYFLSLSQNTDLHRPALFIPFTLLMILHVVLHWMVIPIIQVPKRKAIYVIGQGVLCRAVLCDGRVALHVSFTSKDLTHRAERGEKVARNARRERCGLSEVPRHRDRLTTE